MLEVVKRWSVYIIAVAVLLVAVSTCVNKTGNVISGEKNVYEKQLERRVKTLEQLKRDTNKVLDSVKAEDKKKDKEILKLNKEKSSADVKISELEKQRQADLVKASKKTYKESAEFIADTYNAKKSVIYNDKGVVLNDSVPNLVVETIIESNFLNKKLYQTEIKLDNTEKKVTILNDKVKDKDLVIEKVNILSKEKDSTIAATEELNKTVKKENKNLKRGRFINRLLIVVAFIGGVLIAN